MSGQKKAPRKCSNCFGILDPPGHNKATCPELHPETKFEEFTLEDDGVSILIKQKGLPPLNVFLPEQSPPALQLELADGITAAYIEMNGRIYYIDDSTDEAIMKSWPGQKKVSSIEPTKTGV